MAKLTTSLAISSWCGHAPYHAGRFSLLDVPEAAYGSAVAVEYEGGDDPREGLRSAALSPRLVKN